MHIDLKRDPSLAAGIGSMPRVGASGPNCPQLINFKTMQRASLHWLKLCEKVSHGISVLSRMQFCHLGLLCITMH